VASKNGRNFGLLEQLQDMAKLPSPASQVCDFGVWSITFGEEHRLCVLRRREREEVTGEWRKLHNDRFMICYSSPNITPAIK
jgi:hypothetical protein